MHDEDDRKEMAEAVESAVEFRSWYSRT